MTLQLPEAQQDQLRETADRLGMSAEELLSAAVQFFLSHPDNDLADLLQKQQAWDLNHLTDDDGTEATSAEQLERRRHALSAMALEERPRRSKGDAWQHQVGIFEDDPLMDAIFEAGRQWREADRDQSSE